MREPKEDRVILSALRRCNYDVQETIRLLRFGYGKDGLVYDAQEERLRSVQEELTRTKAALQSLNSKYKDLMKSNGSRSIPLPSPSREKESESDSTSAFKTILSLRKEMEECKRQLEESRGENRLLLKELGKAKVNRERKTERGGEGGGENALF